MLLLQLTDCHLLADASAELLGVRTEQTFLAVLEQALAEATPELLLLTGDLAHDGACATYERIHEHVRARYQGTLIVLPGNHDQGEHLTSVFPDARHPHGIGSRSFAHFELLTVDSQGEDQPEALLSRDAREALRAAVAGASQPVVMVLHHPLLPVGTPWLDKDCVPEGESLLTELADTGKLSAVVFGHVHQPVTAHRGGVALFGTPSTCFQFAPGSQRFSLTSQAPGYRWLRVSEAGGVSTTLRRLAGPSLAVEARFLAPHSPLLN